MVPDRRGLGYSLWNAEAAAAVSAFSTEDSQGYTCFQGCQARAPHQVLQVDQDGQVFRPEERGRAHRPVHFLLPANLTFDCYYLTFPAANNIF